MSTVGAVRSDYPSTKDSHCSMCRLERRSRLKLKLKRELGTRGGLTRRRCGCVAVEEVWNAEPVRRVALKECGARGELVWLTSVVEEPADDTGVR